MERACDHCGATYQRPPSLIGRYCSAKCGHDARVKQRTSYRRIRVDPRHPLAGRTGRVAEARAALFDSIGLGPHECHWCRKVVIWKVGVRGNHPDALVADHLNDDPLDDRPENLVPACGTCNGTRTQRVRDGEVFVMRGRIRHRAVERECERCGTSFLIEPAHLKRGRGRFCSRSCARTKPRS